MISCNYQTDKQIRILRYAPALYYNYFCNILHGYVTTRSYIPKLNGAYNYHVLEFRTLTLLVLLMVGN